MARRCGECGGVVKRFENETFTVNYAGTSAKVEGLSGWRCPGCGEIALNASSARRYAAAGDALVLGRNVA